MTVKRIPHLKIAALFLLGTIFHLSVSAQNYLLRTDTIPVAGLNGNLDLAWAGGLNAPQFSKIDMDLDGTKDLFVFDRTGNKVLTFLNDGSPGTDGYTYHPEYESKFPDLHDWVLLEDYNCDGKFDIFTYSTGGIAIYKNISTTQTGLNFELVTGLLLSYQPPNTINLFVSSTDIPAICDLDNDGDLDILTFGVNGSYLEYHRNLSVENGYGCDTLFYEMRNQCWGYFSESASTNAVTLYDTCQWNVPNPELRPTMQEAALNRHAGSSVLALDMNDDGDKEVVLGDISFTNMTLVTNGGDSAYASAVAQDNSFPDNTIAVDVDIFPAGFHRDFDNDGIRDLLVSPNTPNLSLNKNSVWYYKNNGTDLFPSFSYEQDDLFQEDMIEVGEGAYPVFFDYNNDGLEDLFLGNHGVFDPVTDTYSSGISLYENTGTATSPAFTLITEDFEGLSSIGLGLSVYPAFGDMDGDGDKDMMLGDVSGQLFYFENVAPQGQTADFTLASANYTDFDNNPIDVGQFSTPQFFDVNRDNVLDLLIGERNGNVNYYENIGTATVPSFRLMEDTLGGFSVAEYWDIIGYSVPRMYEKDGDYHLLVGSKVGTLHLYNNIDGNLTGDFNLVDSVYMGINTGTRSAPALVDLNGNGVLDLVLGNYRGGLAFYRGSLTPTVSIHEQEFNPLNVYPNPVNSELTIEMDPYRARNDYTIELMDLSGRVIATYPMPSTYKLTVNVAEFQSGTYFCRVMNEEANHVKIVLIQH